MNSHRRHETEEVTVLIVDDTPANLAVLVESLERMNVEVAVAQDAEEALARAEYLRPALILLDVVMPGVNGFDLCRRLKDQPHTRDIPVIFMTSSLGAENKLEGFEVGAVDFLTKPLHLAEVTARVNVHLALRRMQKELLTRNELLQREIRERAQIEEQLRNTNLELESFTYSVSHDLRAPLRAICGFTNLLAERTDSLDEDARGFLQQIIQAAQRMEGLIRDLLNYARAGQQHVLAVPVALEPLVQQIATTFQARIAECDAHLQIERPLATPWGDPTLLEQILTNLIDNALTYRSRDQRPRITIAAKEVGDHVKLSVSDNGIGIAPEHHERIFQVFQRLHRDSEYAGTGIGLATVAKAARLMNGSVTVQSSPGFGSTFAVTLPVGAPGT